MNHIVYSREASREFPSVVYDRSVRWEIIHNLYIRLYFYFDDVCISIKEMRLGTSEAEDFLAKFGIVL